MDSLIKAAMLALLISNVAGKSLLHQRTSTNAAKDSISESPTYSSSEWPGDSSEFPLGSSSESLPVSPSESLPDPSSESAPDSSAVLLLDSSESPANTSAESAKVSPVADSSAVSPSDSSESTEDSSPKSAKVSPEADSSSAILVDSSESPEDSSAESAKVSPEAGSSAVSPPASSESPENSSAKSANISPVVDSSESPEDSSAESAKVSPLADSSVVSASDSSSEELLTDIFVQSSTHQPSSATIPRRVICPEPMCAEISCKVGYLPEHECPTCICKGMLGPSQSDVESVFFAATRPFLVGSGSENNHVGSTSPVKNIRPKRSENLQAASAQSQSQWTILQQEDDSIQDPLHALEDTEREVEDITGRSESYDELRLFGSERRQKTTNEIIDLDENSFLGVVWSSEVPGCPSPLCADSSCRIGIPPGQMCPTCICKRRMQP